jgi:hypothetical protein
MTIPPVKLISGRFGKLDKNQAFFQKERFFCGRPE